MAALVHNQFISFSEYCRGRRLEQGRHEKASKKGMDEYLKNGALTEGVHNMTSGDELKSAMKDGFQALAMLKQTA